MPATPPRLKRFYVHDLGAVKRADPKIRKGYVIISRPCNLSKCMPLPAGAGSNRMDHIAFNTPMRRGCVDIWRRKGSRYRKAVNKGADASQWFQVKDPEGVTVEFRPALPASIPANVLFPISFTSAPSSRIGRWKTLSTRRAGLSSYWFAA